MDDLEEDDFDDETLEDEDEGEFEEEEEEEEEDDYEDYLNKNSASFRCLKQVLLSSSSLMRNALFFFPPLEDPGLDEVFNYAGDVLIN